MNLIITDVTSHARDHKSVINIVTDIESWKSQVCIVLYFKWGIIVTSIILLKLLLFINISISTLLPDIIMFLLSKHPQRRQGPDLCPLWLLVGTPSAIIPELDFSRAEHSQPYSDVAKYIFDIYYLFTMLFVYWFLWPLRLVWLLVCCLYKEVY